MSKSIIHIGSQFFAEDPPPVETAPSPSPTTETEPAQKPPEEAPPAEAPPPAERTYSQAEVERLLAEGREKALEAYRTEQSEAEKLSKMGRDERMQYELEQAKKKAEDAMSELNAYKLKDEATKLAEAEGLPLSFLGFMDFRLMSAQGVNAAVKEMAAEFKAQLAAKCDERLKQDPPPTVYANSASSSSSEAARFAQSFSKRTELT